MSTRTLRALFLIVVAAALIAAAVVIVLATRDGGGDAGTVTVTPSPRYSTITSTPVPVEDERPSFASLVDELTPSGMQPSLVNRMGEAMSGVVCPAVAAGDDSVSAGAALSAIYDEVGVSPSDAMWITDDFQTVVFAVMAAYCG